MVLLRFPNPRSHGTTLIGFRTTKLFLFEWGVLDTGRCWGAGANVAEPFMLPLELFMGRWGEDRLGLSEDGGVLELYDVSKVEEDLPDVTSPLDCGCDSVEASVRKLALDRRRSSLNKGIVDGDPGPEVSTESTQREDQYHGGCSAGRNERQAPGRTLETKLTGKESVCGRSWQTSASESPRPETQAHREAGEIEGQDGSWDGEAKKGRERREGRESYESERQWVSSDMESVSRTTAADGVLVADKARVDRIPRAHEGIISVAGWT